MKLLEKEFFKILNPALRQTWLIGLGSAKQETDKSVLHTKRNGDKTDKLNRKSTELRLYCDLLVQQVDTIQSLGQD